MVDANTLKVFGAYQKFCKLGHGQEANRPKFTAEELRCALDGASGDRGTMPYKTMESDLLKLEIAAESRKEAPKRLWRAISNPIVTFVLGVAITVVGGIILKTMGIM